MHELSVCQALLDQVESLARQHGARKAALIRLRIGPLSGVEPELLAQAFELARPGTVAEDAELTLEPQPVRVRCEDCGAESEATPNRLLCGACGGYHTRLTSGDELLLASVELLKE